jgi:hypothetical protein
MYKRVFIGREAQAGRRLGYEALAERIEREFVVSGSPMPHDDD